MTYMPTFQQSASVASPDLYQKADAALLRKRCYEGLLRVFATGVLSAEEQVYKQRLDAELKIIEGKCYSSYFLIVADYVGWAEKKGIGVGPGRGSGPCSLVGYVLGITRIDPVRYHLPFERFVNPEREVVPDFDIDFCEKRCVEVSEYILARYGCDRVARISSDDGVALKSRLVITDRLLSELVPVRFGKDSDFPMTTLTMAQVSARGLVRLNVINQKAISSIQHRIKALQNSGNTFELNNIALNDAGTYDTLCKGESSDIDVLDDQAYKAALLAVQPRKFSDLYAAVALSFPFMRSWLPEFVERRNKAESLEFIHPVLEKITAESYGLILYQEQFMYIAHDVSGFTMAKADLFRRALKCRDQEYIAMYKTAFIDGAVRFGLSHKQATDLHDRLVVAGSESVTKAHAVAFAVVVYQEAWLKRRIEVDCT